MGNYIWEKDYLGYSKWFHPNYRICANICESNDQVVYSTYIPQLLMKFDINELHCKQYSSLEDVKLDLDKFAERVKKLLIFE